MDNADALRSGLAALGIDAALAAPLERYLALLNEHNAQYNLTAIREPREQVTKHLLDSLAILPHIPASGRLLDVGTGAGLPGIPLALARPELEVTLLDSRNKKVRFCQAAIAALGLAGDGSSPRVRAVHARVEAFQGPRFDAIVSRAFSSLTEFVTLTAQLGDGETRWLAMKGAKPAAEIAELDAAKSKAGRFWVETIHPIRVPGLEAERCLVVLRRG